MITCLQNLGVGIANGGGTISDMYIPSERAGIFGWYLLGPLLVGALGSLGTRDRRYGRCSDIFTETKERSMKGELFAPYIHRGPLTSSLYCPFYATQPSILRL